MSYRLPEGIYNSSQLRQLHNELTRLRSLRYPKNIVFSSNLQDLASANSIKKLNVATVGDILKFIDTTLDESPELTMTLASAPGVDERDELIARLRRLLHPKLLVHFIIRPELLAGCVVRTKTAIFDMSLARALKDNQQKLVMRLKNA